MSALCRRLVLAWTASAWAWPAHAQAISEKQAVALAEAFVGRNGYTQLPRSQLSANLDPESFELDDAREQQLEMRFNTLNPKAIGIRAGQKGEQQGWSVAFDFADAHADSSACRVVTMDANGQHLVMQHVNGFRSHFAELDERRQRAQLRQ